MSPALSDQAQRVMKIAADEARSFNHTYVGTEHVLLALVQQPESIESRVLSTLGVDAQRVREEIAKLVTPGADISEPAAELPLTPRVKWVIDDAAAQAGFLSQKQISRELLLLSLLRQPDGVAGIVLRNLGIKVSDLAAGVMKTRLAQMKIVERAVRPVRAGTPQKRRMREELLAHLESIYHEEYDRLGDTDAAMQQAAQRFGDPTELANELERALPARERRAHWIERRFGWRAPESVARFVVRLSMQLLMIMAVVCAIGIVASTIVAGRDALAWPELRSVAAFCLLVAADQLLLGLLYFKMRDALWGVFGSARSFPRAVACAGLTACVVFFSAIGFLWIVSADLRSLLPVMGGWCGASVAVASGYFLYARTRGAVEIRDTIWACLDLA